MRTVERIRQLQALDSYIESQINQLKKLKSQALKISASLPQPDKVKGESHQKIDDVYTELIDLQEELQKTAVKALKSKIAFIRQISEIKDEQARYLLQLVYIEHLSIDDICERYEGITRKTYYMWLRRAEKYLEG